MTMARPWAMAAADPIGTRREERPHRTDKEANWRNLRSLFHFTRSLGCGWCLLAQAFDLRESGRAGPVFEEPGGERLGGVRERQALVLVAATVREQAQRVPHLVIDFETVAVWIGEINAALADMIDSALDLEPACQEVGVGVAQCGVAVDLEGDVHEPELAGPRSDRVGGCGMLRDVERVEPVAQRHEHAAMFRVLLGDAKAKHVAVEPL